MLWFDGSQHFRTFYRFIDVKQRVPARRTRTAVILLHIIADVEGVLWKNIFDAGSMQSGVEHLTVRFGKARFIRRSYEIEVGTDAKIFKDSTQPRVEVRYASKTYARLLYLE